MNSTLMYHAILERVFNYLFGGITIIHGHREFIISCLLYTWRFYEPQCILGYLFHSKMPTVRNARSLVTSRELPSGLQIWMKGRCSVFYPSKHALFSVGTMNADTDSASEESVKVIQGRVAHGTLYVRLTCPTMDNRHNKPSQVPEF